MVTWVVAACAVLAACGLALVAARRSRVESERRLELVLERIDGHLETISTNVDRAVGRMVEALDARRDVMLTLDFDELVETIVAEAAARTEADAVVLRVEGPGGRPVIASTGHGVAADLPERAYAPPGQRAFRAATIDWTYSPSGEADDDVFHSALVAPLRSTAGVAGTLVAYATAPHAFRAEHSRALHELLADVSTGLANARRFADVETRLLLDPATGVANRRGYELELGREVARAQRSGRPLSVVVVGLGDGSQGTSPGGGPTGADEVARLLTRVTRKRDISCRRGEREFAILLPETREPGATVLTTRLREEARRALGASRSTIELGYVEWRPDESVEALESRVDSALASPRGTRSSTTPDWGRRPAPTPPRRSSAAETGPTAALRRDALDALARELLAAQRLAHSLAVVALEVDGLDELSERLDRESADSVVSGVAHGLAESVGSGTVHRLGSGAFALVLSGTADDAEALLGTLHSSAEVDRELDVTLSAGITEVVERDDAQSALGRAEHALWQAKQAGPGTVVVAVPGRRKPRFD